MLVDDPMLTTADRDRWADWERYDTQIGASAVMDRMETDAIAVIREFVESAGQDSRPVVCSVSWGKDSVVVAHLTHLAAPQVPVVWVPTIRSDGASYEADATYQVRDLYLAAHPGQPYQERPAVAVNPKRGDAGYRPDQHTRPGYKSQDVLTEQITERYISGLRAQESKARAVSIARRGKNTKNTSRPIAHWAAEHVFAYLAARDLPVHPTYAATYGGRLDRRWLRVHPLRSKPPARSAVYGRDMDTWEDDYYPALVAHRPPAPIETKE